MLLLCSLAAVVSSKIEFSSDSLRDSSSPEDGPFSFRSNDSSSGMIMLLENLPLKLFDTVIVDDLYWGALLYFLWLSYTLYLKVMLPDPETSEVLSSIGTKPVN